MIRTKLFALRDEGYRLFNARLLPTVEMERVIGVRTPALRALAKELRGTAEAEAFLADLPHFYFEENNLHAFLIEGERDFEACMERVNAFLPFVDNWATCDQLLPKVFGKYPEELRKQIAAWLASDHCYTIRYGIGMLMRWFLDEGFDSGVLDQVAAIRSGEYYVNMMIAWFFATALAKQWDAALPYIENHVLDDWTHNKAIQKAVESYRISDAGKEYLRGLKISGRKLS